MENWKLAIKAELSDLLNWFLLQVAVKPQQAEAAVQHKFFFVSDGLFDRRQRLLRDVFQWLQEFGDHILGVTLIP